MKNAVTAFYFPLFLLVWSNLVSIASGFLAGMGDQTKDPSKLVATNYTIQIAIAAGVNLLFFLFLPRFAFPRSWVVGDTKADYWYEANITRGTITWCLIIGVITQLLLMTFVEIFSSKVYKLV